jgi:hypothetical protein
MHITATRILVAAAISGALLGTEPAMAASYGVSFSTPGISFSYNSGGYCDAWGCPDSYWDYPIYYCPVYYGGQWYRGPVYYRMIFGRPYYWLHGDWRRDAWIGPRPVWACVDRFGPPLDLDFYIWNGFSVRDDWRYAWRNHRDDWWRHRRDWDRDHHNDRNWHSWLPTAQRNYDWNRERDWNKDRDWTKPGWNRRDWDRKNRIAPPGRPGSPPSEGAVPKVITPPAVIHAPPREKNDAPWQKGERGHSWPGASQDRSRASTTSPSTTRTPPSGPSQPPQFERKGSDRKGWDRPIRDSGTMTQPQSQQRPDQRNKNDRGGRGNKDGQ